MHPDTHQTHQDPRPSFRTTKRRVLQFLIIGLIVVAVPFALYVRVKSEHSSALKDKPRKAQKDQVTVWAAGRGKPFLNLQDGRRKTVKYDGDQQAVVALQSGAAQARALASADFDLNGTPDVVAGYSFNGTGLITVQRGNPDAFAPTDSPSLCVFNRATTPTRCCRAQMCMRFLCHPIFL